MTDIQCDTCERTLKENELPENIPKNPWTGNVDKMFTRAVFINLSFY